AFKIILAAFIFDLLTNIIIQIIYIEPDFSLIKIFTNFEFALWCQVLTLGGLSTCYLSLAIWLKLKNIKKAGSR
nr:hypothetical protein [Candidatus Gastranaerophilales bacterium]